MRFSEILAASSLVAPFVAAHGDHIPGMPKIFGLGAGVKARDFPGFAAARRAALPQNKRYPHDKRQQGGTDGQCGPAGNGASCAEGYCCSPSGWCGNSKEYCAAPDCLIDFGPGCDANKIPNGDSTRDIPRPQLGDIEYGGEGIYPCVEPGTIAITYDDGPYIYTAGVLDQFANYSMKATFFITGNNLGKGAIDDASTPWPALIQRMIAEGHQVASHTWSHQDLSAITQSQRIDQMVHNEMAIRNIIQKFPTYMRPPYSSCTEACQADLRTLGYVVTYFDLDTTDYLNVTPDLIQNAKTVFNTAVSNSDPTTKSFLAIAHDIHQQTAQNLTGYMLQTIQDKGYRGVTVGECLGDPEANWYRSSSGRIVTSSSATGSATPTASGTSSVTPTATPTGTSQDGTCGPAVSLSCIGFSEGSCCSQYGFCGSTTDHCGAGCQSVFGTCGSSPNNTQTSSTVSSTAPTATPSNLVTSPDATCGGNTGYTCIGFPEGECCSQYGFCGTTTDHCGTGCNPLFGNCGGSGSGSGSSSASPSASAGLTEFPSSNTPVVTPSPSVPVVTSSTIVPTVITSTTRTTATTATTAAPTSTGAAVSKNGKCGSKNKGTTCRGYKGRFSMEECCRFDGSCGAGVLACGLGCQKKYGTCWW